MTGRECNCTCQIAGAHDPDCAIYRPSLSALDLIAAERIRQVTEEGYTLDHDTQHTQGELARAGAVYALRAVNAGGVNPYDPMKYWPADWHFKQDFDRDADPVVMLVKAAALIAAEIDRRTGTGGAS